jgi:hypothetical protein
VVLCAAMQGVPPAAYRSHGPAAVARRGLVPRSARAVARVREKRDFEDILEVCFGVELGIGAALVFFCALSSFQGVSCSYTLA